MNLTNNFIRLFSFNRLYRFFFGYFFLLFALVLVEANCFCLFNFVIIFTAAGLQVLQEKHLIHRDLKPQVLCLALF